MCCADDNIPYVCLNILTSLQKEKLEEVGKVLFEWFSKMVYKCHLILRTDEPFLININNKVKIVTVKTVRN